MTEFLEFVDRKKRETKHHLVLIHKLFNKMNMKAEAFFDENEPYVFLNCPDDLSFGGIRIYEIGNKVVFRVQKENKTHPYGRAYLLDLQEMFNDFLSEHLKEEEAGKKVVESVVKEVANFFQKSKKAEEDLQTLDNGGKIIASTVSIDYGSMIGNSL